ncbi:MAG: hypothetical protein JOY75_14850, partial [Hyphomicrobiales bacterium]|nr:hypothetical protein [Hyphomicrobiales bacterium]
MVDSITGETVDPLDEARGYEVGENRFLLVEDHELEQARTDRTPPGALQLAEPSRSAPAPFPIRAAEPDEDDDEEQGRAEDAERDEQLKAHLVPRPKNTRTIEIERFLPPGQVDARYFDKPYYV